LDVAQHEITQKVADTGLLWVEAMKMIGTNADAMATAKHELQGTVIDLTDEAFWNRHTNSKGLLVSLNEDDEEEPMRRVDVMSFIAKREKDVTNKAKSMASWERHKAQRNIALGEYKALLSNLIVQEGKIWDKRQEASSAMNQTIGVLGSVASGLAGVAIGGG